MTNEIKIGAVTAFENGVRVNLLRMDGLPAPETFLSAMELQKYASFKIEKRKRDWLGGRYAAKTLLKETLAPETPLSAIEISYDPSGRPVSKLGGDSPRLISITHSGPFCAAACGTAGTNFIGIDLEKDEPRIDAWYRDYFHKSELKLDGEAASQLDSQNGEQLGSGAARQLDSQNAQATPSLADQPTSRPAVQQPSSLADQPSSRPAVQQPSSPSDQPSSCPAVQLPAALATRLWTQKEALLKALGIGLAADPLDINLAGSVPQFSRKALKRYEELGKPPFEMATFEPEPGWYLTIVY